MDTSTTTPTGLHAVVLIVPDLEASRAFYAETLGLELDADHGDAVFFRLGRQKLALFARDHHPEGDDRLGGADHGVSHLEFAVPPDRRQALENRLQDAGTARAGGCYEDPAGILFHFVNEPAAEADAG